MKTALTFWALMLCILASQTGFAQETSDSPNPTAEYMGPNRQIEQIEVPAGHADPSKPMMQVSEDLKEDQERHQRLLNELRKLYKANFL